jgi:hypothetical protein
MRVSLIYKSLGVLLPVLLLGSFIYLKGFVDDSQASAAMSDKEMSLVYGGNTDSKCGTLKPCFPGSPPPSGCDDLGETACEAAMNALTPFDIKRCDTVQVDRMCTADPEVKVYCAWLSYGCFWYKDDCEPERVYAMWEIAECKDEEM